MVVFEAFKRLDLFGSQVKLGVNREHKTHRTCLGACVSMIYLVAVIWIMVQFTGQSAQNLKFPASWVKEAEEAVQKAEAAEAKLAAKVKADAAKVKADAAKLKGDARRLL